MKKRMLAVILSIMLVAAMLAGCDASKHSDGEDSHKVGITIQNLSNAYWAGVMGKLGGLLDEKGWDYTIVDCKDNSGTQISQIENFIISGCDLIMVHASDAVAVEGVCKEAMERGIKVMCWDDPMENTTAHNFNTSIHSLAAYCFYSGCIRRMNHDQITT